MIVAGEKTEEYRAVKSYWINRLIQAKYGGSDEYRKVTMHPEFDMLISNSKLKELKRKPLGSSLTPTSDSSAVMRKIVR